MDGRGQGGRADSCYGVKEDLSVVIGRGRIVRGLDGRFGMRGEISVWRGFRRVFGVDRS